MICANEGCGKEFEPQTHNQKYHSAECCREATNRRIKAEYHANRARLRGAERRCHCGNLLSRYNPGRVCAQCEAKKEVSIRTQIIEVFSVYQTTLEA